MGLGSVFGGDILYCTLHCTVIVAIALEHSASCATGYYPVLLCMHGVPSIAFYIQRPQFTADQILHGADCFTSLA